WATFMGTTFPWMLAFLRSRQGGGGERNFSFLYVANVVGAALGAWLTAYVLIELAGFSGTLAIAGSLNLAAALIAFRLAAQSRAKAKGRASQSENAPRSSAATLSASRARRVLVLLFSTGFISMAMEVAWTRSYGAVLYNTIYAFALILVAYLVANAIG